MGRTGSGGAIGVVFRRELDRRSVLRGAAALGLLGAAGGAYRWRAQAWAQEASGDVTVDLLNFARTMEGLLCAAYEYALDDEDYMTERDQQFLRPILNHEMAYVENFGTLIERAGGTPVELPEYNFSEEEMGDRIGCLRTLSQLEETGIQGWHGQITTVRDPDLIVAMRPVLMEKARHAAVVASLLEDAGAPFPAPIESTILLEQALDAIAPFRGAE